MAFGLADNSAANFFLLQFLLQVGRDTNKISTQQDELLCTCSPQNVAQSDTSNQRECTNFLRLDLNSPGVLLAISHVPTLLLLELCGTLSITFSVTQ